MTLWTRIKTITDRVDMADYRIITAFACIVTLIVKNVADWFWP